MKNKPNSVPVSGKQRPKILVGKLHHKYETQSTESLMVKMDVTNSTVQSMNTLLSRTSTGL
jgi:hypothetical protein